MVAIRSCTVVVEVCSAQNLMPKDGQGSANAYVEVELDNQRRRTRTVPRDLNPVWKEELRFHIGDTSVLDEELIDINVYSDKKQGKGHFLGRVRIHGKLALVAEASARTQVHPLDKRSLFSNIRGEISLKIFYRELRDPKSSSATSSSSSLPPSAREPQGSNGSKAKSKSEPIASSSQKKVSFSSSSSTSSPDESKPIRIESLGADEFERKAAAIAEQSQFFYAQQQLFEPKKVRFHQGSASSSASSANSDTMTAGGRPPSNGPQANAPTDFNLRETKPKLSATARRAEKGSSTYDLVERMEYLYVKVVKAKGLAAKDAIASSSDPYVLVKVGSLTARTRAIERSLSPEWNQVFAFGKDKFQAALLEITVKDRDGLKDDFLGGIAFDIAEIPIRVPPDSPLAPQWYKLENKKGGNQSNLGEIMVSVWRGTQADEAFPEAWQSDSGGHPLAKSKVYLSPRLWYLRVNVIEAQDLVVPAGDKGRFPDVRLRAQLGFQVAVTRPSSSRSSSPFWNEDLLFVAAEPFEDPLILSIEDRVGPNKDQTLGRVVIAIAAVERRVDHRQVSSRWYNLERHHEKPAEGGQQQQQQQQPNNPNNNNNNNSSPPKPKDGKFMSRVHLRICLDGGYHVLDESTLYSSDMRPSAKSIWRPPIGVLELGILGGSGFVPMKSKEARGSTDAYVVAKYGEKWVRSRTVVDSFAPRWNEQYTWEVYDPCTVLTVGVFDNSHLSGGSNGSNGGEAGNGKASRDARIGKVRIRLSTLESDRVYTHSYPLLLLQPAGVKKMGELELALRFSSSSSSSSLINVLACYARPILPKMHYLHPIGVGQLEVLRNHAMRIVAARLTRAEPPFRAEVVQFMLDVDSNLWSMRRSKANWFRILGVLSGAVAVARWFSDICRWRNPVTTVLVHFLFLVLVLYPELILPTLFLYMFLIGSWHYRFRPRHPPHMDPRLSHAESADLDELDEEFDMIPTSKPQEVVRARYDRLRAVSGRIQTVLGDMATQGERLQALLSWRDPRATSVFVLFCLVSALLLYVTPLRIVALLVGFYVLRHPRFRSKLPGAHMNFFRRLPALSDRML